MATDARDPSRDAEFRAGRAAPFFDLVEPRPAMRVLPRLGEE